MAHEVDALSRTLRARLALCASAYMKAHTLVYPGALAVVTKVVPEPRSPRFRGFRAIGSRWAATAMLVLARTMKRALSGWRFGRSCIWQPSSILSVAGCSPA